MDIVTLLSPDRIHRKQEVSSKKRAFEVLADLLAKGQLDPLTQSSLSPETIFDALLNREKLGSTTLGNGIAIPHACLSITTPVAALLLVDEGLKMDTPDKKPVRAFLAILVPEAEASIYSASMTELAMELTRHDICTQLEKVSDANLIMEHISQVFVKDIAA